MCSSDLPVGVRAILIPILPAISDDDMAPRVAIGETLLKTRVAQLADERCRSLGLIHLHLDAVRFGQVGLVLGTKMAAQQ